MSTKPFDPIVPENRKTLAIMAARASEEAERERADLLEAKTRQEQSEAARTAELTEFEKAVRSAVLSLDELIKIIGERYFPENGGSRDIPHFLKARAALSAASNLLRAVPAQTNHAPER